MQMPSLYKKYHYLPKRDQKQFFAFPEKLGNDQIPFFFAKLPYFDPSYNMPELRSQIMFQDKSYNEKEKITSEKFTSGILL